MKKWFNKNRLYVTLHIRGGKPKMPNKEDTWHWALMMGPKVETPRTTRTTFQAKECINESGKMSWRYDEDKSSARPHHLLVCIMIAKVEDTDRLLGILREIPIRAGDEGWNCVGWVKEALDVVCNDGQTVGRCVLDWDRVRDCAMKFCREKIKEGRFDVSGGFDISIVPTYDLILEKEIIGKE